MVIIMTLIIMEIKIKVTENILEEQAKFKSNRKYGKYM